MSSTQVARRKRQRNIESIAPALALLARPAQAKQVAQMTGVSSATILNWMDWAWKRREQIEPYLLEHYPDVTQEQWNGLWARIAWRRTRRDRRADFGGMLSKE